MHWLDEGAGEDVLLCLQVAPSRSSLSREMIPDFARGGRVDAPDLTGPGGSGPVHSFVIQREAPLALIAWLDLTDIALVCPD